MKIALISCYDFAIPGGVRNHTLGLAQELKRQGHQVHTIAPSSNNNITTHYEDFIQIATFPKASHTGFIPPHLLLAPSKIVVLQKMLKNERYDLIHIQEPLLPPLCLSVPLHTSTPLFATFHTFYEQGMPMYRLFRPLLNRWLNRLTGRIAVSQPAKDYIEQYFPYDYKIIPNGVNIEKFSVITPPHPAMDPNHFNLLFIGHAQFKRKGLRYLIEAYRLLKHQYPMLRLIVAGTKWAGREKPTELSHGLCDILYLGTVDDNELVSLFRSADVFCAPSTGNESFGMVLTEAMAVGTAIVTTNIKGYKEVVRDGHEALLVPPKNSHALRDAIQRLIEDRVLKKRLGEQGQLSVKRYAWTTVANDVMSYYVQKLSSGLN